MSILNTVGSEVSESILDDTGLNWDVVKSDGLLAPTSYGVNAGTAKKCATVRVDTNEILGVVSPDYQVVQNRELAYMAQRVAGNGLKVDSGGTLRGGARVWLSVTAPSFDVNGCSSDTVNPFLLLTNGHDGLFSLSGTPTSRRVYCENTLNMALAEGRKQNMCISIRHKGNMQEKMEDLMNTIDEFYHRTEVFQKQANLMAGIPASSDVVRTYFKDVYTKFVGEMPEDATTREEERKQTKYYNTVSKWWNTFDDESYKLGTNLWIAFNAVTNWIDHSSGFRGANKAENKFMHNFYGSGANKKQNILSHTLTEYV